MRATSLNRGPDLTYIWLNWQCICSLAGRDPLLRRCALMCVFGSDAAVADISVQVFRCALAQYIQALKPCILICAAAPLSTHYIESTLPCAARAGSRGCVMRLV